jgi:hypothetical protein
MNATRRDLEIQFRRVINRGWWNWFRKNAHRAGTTTSHLLAIGSRETNLQNIRGDFRDGKYHGFGIMQVDIGTDSEYARTWTADKVERGIDRGTDIFIGKVNDTRSCVGKKVLSRNKWFVGKAVEIDDLRRIATAAYNCGRWAHYHFSRGENLDSTTTGKDYSRDVYDRAIEFAELLEDGGYEENAVRLELRLQGKYARKAHLDRFGVEPEVERVKLPEAEPQESPEELERADYERDSAEVDEDPAANTSASKGELGENVDSQSAMSVPDPPPPSDTNAAATKTVTATAVADDNKSVVQRQETKVEDRPGTNPKDPAVQVSTGGGISRFLTTVGGVGGLMTAIGGYFSGNAGLIAVGIVCATVVILALIFRQVIMDWARVHIAADPNRYNVK